MPLKKQNHTDEEIPIFDEAFIYKRGAYWHFRMWLNNERKYARKNLRTRSKTTAIEKGKEAYLEILDFTGVSSPYEPPISLEVHLKTGIHDLQKCTDQIINYLSTNQHFLNKYKLVQEDQS